MRYHEALDKYIEELYQKRYKQCNINRKKSSLKNWFPYVIALFHPDVPRVLLGNTDMLDTHHKAYPDTGHEEIKEIE